jgi:hypothetical protein
MATAVEILNSPDYANANPATKQAIFDKHIASTPAFANANEATQAAIRSRFGLALPESGIPQGRTGADQIPGILPQVQPVAEPERSFLDKARGVVETGAGLVSGIVTAPVITGAEILGTLTSGKFGTPEGIRAGEDLSKRVAQQIQYQPRTQAGQEYTQAVGNALARTGLQGVPINVLNELGVVARPAIQSAPGMARSATTNALARIASNRVEEPGMVGMGAASTEQALQRQVTAEGLRVPVRLTKGQATREPGQQQFEAETAKTYPETVGRPLVEQRRATNDAILKNFDAYADATGSERYGAEMLRPIGKVVDDALVKSANEAKSRIRQAYAAAEQSGEMQAPIPYQRLVDYINRQGATVREKLAPILAGVEDQIKINDPQGTGQISINSMEDIRKFINANTQEGTPNAVHARQLKSLIDQTTEGAGGDLYRAARELRVRYARDFENAGFVDRLLKNKPGTTDRAVALEDVWDHAIMRGSLDDTRAIALTLKKAGPEGQQAWRELQGQTIAMMKDAVTKGVSRDLSGNRIVSPAKFDSFVRELDSSGKLDYLFGKKGAEEIRALRDTALDVYTTVPGAVNTSNTASSLIRALEGMNKSPLGRVPGVGSAIEYAAERARTNQLARQVGEAVNFNAMNPP